MNKTQFKTSRGSAFTPKDADTVNLAGGVAYSLTNCEALAQMIMTGTFNGTYYASASNQVDEIIKLLNKIESEEEVQFVAKLAIYARKQGFMKDTPAFLTAWLSNHGPQYLEKVFNSVIDNGKMLRNFVQVMRSGVIGRKSLGTKSKKLVQKWLQNASINQLIRASVGNNPSLSDVFKMVHPAPLSLDQNILFKWFVHGEVEKNEFDRLPGSIKELIEFRRGNWEKIPNVPFELLTSNELTRAAWIQIARNASFQMARMNINTFMRNGVLDDKKTLEIIVSLLKNKEEISRSKVFPYQIFTTWLNINDQVPMEITNALEIALNHSLNNVPVYDGKTYVFVDVSGSMSSPITGYRRGSSSKISCVEVAALFASSLLRVNSENTEIILFDTKLHNARLNVNNSVMQNATIISGFGGCGTACQLPLQRLVNQKAKGDLIIYISDNESWLNTYPSYRNSSTKTSLAWSQFKKINPNAKMVCIDLTPNTTTQMYSTKDVLNVGGFNDSVYNEISNFIKSNSPNHWVNLIQDSVSL